MEFDWSNCPVFQGVVIEMSKLFIKIREDKTNLTWKTSLETKEGLLAFTKEISDLILNLTMTRSKNKKK